MPRFNVDKFIPVNVGVMQPTSRVGMPSGIVGANVSETTPTAFESPLTELDKDEQEALNILSNRMNRGKTGAPLTPKEAKSISRLPRDKFQNFTDLFPMYNVEFQKALGLKKPTVSQIVSPSAEKIAQMALPSTPEQRQVEQEIELTVAQNQIVNNIGSMLEEGQIKDLSLGVKLLEKAGVKRERAKTIIDNLVFFGNIAGAIALPQAFTPIALAGGVVTRGQAVVTAANLMLSPELTTAGEVGAGPMQKGLQTIGKVLAKSISIVVDRFKSPELLPLNPNIEILRHQLERESVEIGKKGVKIKLSDILKAERNLKAKSMYKTDLPPAKVDELHSKITNIIEQKIAKRAEKLQKQYTPSAPKVTERLINAARNSSLKGRPNVIETVLTPEQTILKRNYLKDSNDLDILQKSLRLYKQGSKTFTSIRTKINKLEKKVAGYDISFFKDNPTIGHPIPDTVAAKTANSLLDEFHTDLNMASGYTKKGEVIHEELTDVDISRVIDEYKSDGAKSTGFVKLRNTGVETLYAIGSPDKIMRRDPVATKIYDALRVANSYSERLNRQFKGLIDFIGIKGGGEESFLFADLMRKHQNWKEVPEIIELMGKKYNKNDLIKYKDSFNTARESTDFLFELTNQALPNYLPRERYLRNYLYRIWSKKDLARNIVDRIDELKSLKSLTVEEQESLQKYVKVLNEYNTSGGRVLDYNNIPKDLILPQTMSRVKTDMPLKEDYVKAMLISSDKTGKKIFEEPALKYALDNVEKITDPNIKKYTKWFINQYYTGSKDTGLDRIADTVVSLEYLHALGGNWGSFLTNASQHINTVAEVGLVKTVRSIIETLVGTRNFRRVWPKSTHFNDFEVLLKQWGAKLGTNIAQSILYPINIAEIGNRKVAFYAGYLDAMSRKNKIPFINDALKRGFSLEEAAIAWGDRVCDNTQFLYGRMGASKLYRNSIGRTTLQFTTFSTKQMELMYDWARKNPKKLLVYLAAGQGVNTAASTIGIDMSNATQIIKPYEMYRAARDLFVPSDDERKNMNRLVTGITHFGSAIQPILSGQGIAPSSMLAGPSTIYNILTKGAFYALPISVQRWYKGLRAYTEGQEDSYEFVKVDTKDENKWNEAMNKILEISQIKVGTYDVRPKKGYTIRTPNPEPLIIQTMNLMNDILNKNIKLKDILFPKGSRVSAVLTDYELVTRTLGPRTVQERIEYLVRGDTYYLTKMGMLCAKAAKQSAINGNRENTVNWARAAILFGYPIDLDKSIENDLLAGKIPASVRNIIRNANPEIMRRIYLGESESEAKRNVYNSAENEGVK